MCFIILSEHEFRGQILCFTEICYCLVPAIYCVVITKTDIIDKYMLYMACQIVNDFQLQNRSVF